LKFIEQENILKLVMIEWLDSLSGCGWQSIEQIRDSRQPLYCRSVGWLVSENKKCNIIVPHISGEKKWGYKAPRLWRFDNPPLKLL
jgi:hypothetical protein